ncbi:hypothetical protein J769_3069 [Acinetobacter baumannii 25307_6]|nr:hypothetical protein J769_3069 [Acinetobacter baumannii 25307_6]
MIKRASINVVATVKSVAAFLTQLLMGRTLIPGFEISYIP